MHLTSCSGVFHKDYKNTTKESNEKGTTLYPVAFDDLPAYWLVKLWSGGTTLSNSSGLVVNTEAADKNQQFPKKKRERKGKLTRKP